MRVVPELVFVNCCYLGQVGDTRRSRPYNRARFASGVAGALIDIGVRCVIAAGWAVDDAAATDFATTFYDGILRGDRFIDAVGQARRVAWEQHRDVNTWAAYQCYGDADWRFQPKAPDANQVRTDDREFSGIATDVAPGPRARPHLRRDQIPGRRPRDAGRQTAEARTTVRADLGSTRAGSPKDSGAPMPRPARWIVPSRGTSGRRRPPTDRRRSAPPNNWATCRADPAGSWSSAPSASATRCRLRPTAWRRRSPAATRAARAAARDALKDAQRRLTDATRSAGILIKDALDGLRALQRIRPTMERQSLIASAIKRRVLVDIVAGRAARARRDLIEMRKIYAEAVRIGQGEKNAELHYPASNCLAADLVLGSRKTRVTLDKKYVAITGRQRQGAVRQQRRFLERRLRHRAGRVPGDRVTQTRRRARRAQTPVPGSLRAQDVGADVGVRLRQRVSGPRQVHAGVVAEGAARGGGSRQVAAIVRASGGVAESQLSIAPPLSGSSIHASLTPWLVARCCRTGTTTGTASARH